MYVSLLCTYGCICMCIGMHIYVYVHVFMYANVMVYDNVCTYVYVWIYVHIIMNDICVYICMCSYFECVYIFVRILS